MSGSANRSRIIIYVGQPAYTHTNLVESNTHLDKAQPALGVKDILIKPSFIENN